MVTATYEMGILLFECVRLDGSGRRDDGWVHLKLARLRAVWRPVESMTQPGSNNMPIRQPAACSASLL